MHPEEIAQSGSKPSPTENAGASNAPSLKAKPRRKFQGTSKKSAEGSSAASKRRLLNHIPDDILHDEDLNEAIAALPSNYSFEIHKTVHQLRRDKITTVALQMPEGLMIYGPVIADILEEHTYPKRTPEERKAYGDLFLQPLLLADVTYGACCIDDFTAKEMGAEMIVHYGHSCLIPVSQTTLKTLYIFVEIGIDPVHLALSVRRNFPCERSAFRRQVLSGESVGERVGDSQTAIQSQRPAEEDASSAPEGIRHMPDAASTSRATRLALVSTIQFVAAVHDLKVLLETALPDLTDSNVKAPASSDAGSAKEALMAVRANELGVWRGAYEIVVPQVRPLSPGEILGCTAPKLGKDIDAILYVGDGRFHLESIMIANPTIPAFRYDPYDKKFTAEGYNHEEMRQLRAEAIFRAKAELNHRSDHGATKTLPPANEDSGLYSGNAGASGWGVVLGTLGRQGSLSVLRSITSALPPGQFPPYLLLLSELSPMKLDMLSSSEITTFVQTSCPRLSIDWGYAFSRPLLTPYEANVALGKIQGWQGLEAGPVQVLGGDDSEAKEVKTSPPPHSDYPMDFYSDDSLGPWTPRHGMGAPHRSGGPRASPAHRLRRKIPHVEVATEVAV